MKTRQSLLLSVFAVALAAPGFSFAESLWEPAKGSAGGNFRQDHFVSTKTRAQVSQEVEAARLDGSLLSTSELERGLKVSAKQASKMGAMREPVKDMQVTMSTDDKQNSRLLYRGR